MDDLNTVITQIYPFFALGILVEAIWYFLVRKEHYPWGESFASLVIFVSRFLVSGIQHSIIGGIFSFIYEHRFFTIELNNLLSWSLLFFGSEFFYYWYHRFAHTVRWFWVEHNVHHTPEKITLSAAYRLGLFGFLAGAWIFNAPLVLLGFHPLGVVSMIALNLLYQFWLHNDIIPKLGWIEGIFNTPSNHRVHHASNEEYLDKNFGGILMIYDRLFGTYAEEPADQNLKYGITKPFNTLNPMVLAFGEFGRLIKDLSKARSPKEFWGYLFLKPGWKPSSQLD
ncbi:MAG: sterol desaturase family protein [Candidatus Caenarcaniphilales bacterium]|nr:sterol desaturase family protein [Candidatus Caenarcaniphilales bacterium]